MDASRVKEILNEQDIYYLLEELGAEPKWEGNIESRTRCHNHAHEGKHKLVYYSDNKMFRCYTGCGNLDIFSLIQRVYDLDFYGAYKYICSKFGIDMTREVQTEKSVDKSYFEKFKKKDEEIILTPLNKNILNSWLPIYHQSWINDGISIQTMQKFGIRFSVMNNQIIIPHYNENNNLVGVRSRNLKKEIVDLGKKYMPVYYKKNVLKHPTGACLYGLNITKDQIEKYKTVIIFESEKSVLQLDTMFPDRSIGVCISGSSITNYQLNILKKLDIEEVIIALDKEFSEVGSDEEKFYAQKIQNVFASKLSPYFRTSVIWDVDGLINEKDSPTDCGSDIFKTLFRNRIFI
ncbi:hypothetical protein [Staphylococcus equorum]|uniref:Zinc finger CHC2-type domain-containing protein n=1 Tax=Staphylococcus equorum TaxID=246432 RepID=A0A9X4LHX2_9STAP|nr:hypothetical protein [Staphylococcus equorum]MDG0860378.1 hypothetical protein [Staphylococcus equorum]